MGCNPPGSKDGTLCDVPGQAFLHRFELSPFSSSWLLAIARHLTQVEVQKGIISLQGLDYLCAMPSVKKYTILIQLDFVKIPAILGQPS